ncbi:MAG: hypothetical protein AMXMBFR77_27780 [Phycisphaerales bacterium]
MESDVARTLRDLGKTMELLAVQFLLLATQVERDCVRGDLECAGPRGGKPGDRGAISPAAAPPGPKAGS